MGGFHKFSWSMSLEKDGYAVLRNKVSVSLVDPVRKTLESVIETLGNPQLLILTDSVWELIESLPKPADTFVPSGDITVFYRSKDKDHVGFQGFHRDMPNANESSFLDGDVPGSYVAWVPLNSATLHGSSCLQVYPKDKWYYLPGHHFDPPKGDAPVTIEAEPGDVVYIGHKVLHSGTPCVGHPRMTLAVVFVDVRIPKLVPRFCTNCREERTLLMAALGLYYRRSLKWSESDLRLFYQILLSQEGRKKALFDPVFWAKSMEEGRCLMQD